MSRRIRSKNKRMHGSRTWGAGNTKNRRGKGNKGGKGRAGGCKHKWLKMIKSGQTKPPKGFNNPTRTEVYAITLDQLGEEIRKGKWPLNESTGAYEINLKDKDVKLLGSGKLEYKANVTASSLTKKAEAKITAKGGTVAK